jgi:O-antigen/teichoic acid export membrane protein
MSILLEQTSTRQNLSANLVSRILSGVVNLACVPVFLRVLGVSGYGLIGIWGLLETFANLLDLGLSPTMTREMAATSREPESVAQLRDLVRTLELGYWAIGLLIGAGIALAAPLMAAHWLHSNNIPPHVLRSAIVLIGLLIVCRWPLSFYGGGLSGLERQVLLSWVSFFFLCARNLGAIAIMVWVSPAISSFFLWQVVINLVQTAVFAALLWSCLPAGPKPVFRLALVRRIRRFAVGLTAVTLVSMLLTELDKLVISKQLPLEAFGYYSLGWSIAASLYLVSAPVFSALFPVLTRYARAGATHELAAAYHRAAQMISVLVMPAAVTFIFFARPLIFAWTGNAATADRAWLSASLLTAGTAFNCIVSIPYALQLAYGWTSLAFWTNLLSAFVTIPLLLILTARFGGPGAASVWLIINASYLLTQVQLMHRRYLTGERLRWYAEDVALPLLTSVGVTALTSRFASAADTRIGILLLALVSGSAALAASAIATPIVRKYLRDMAAARRHAFAI